MRNKKIYSLIFANSSETPAKNKELTMSDEAILFAHRPKQMVPKKIQDWSKPISTVSALKSIIKIPVWSVALIIPISLIYNLGFENNILQDMNYAQVGIISSQVGSSDIELFCFRPNTRQADFPATKSVELVSLCLYLNKFDFFKIKTDPSKSSEPQAVSFSFGPGVLVLDNVIIEKLGEKAYPRIFILLYAFITALCLHPPAKILGKKQSFINAFRISALFFVYLVTIVIVLFFAAAVAIVHVFNIAENYGFLALGVSAIAFVWLLLRGFFGIYPELYGVTKKRMLVILLSAVLLSYIISPIYLTLGVYGVVRYLEYFNVVFSVIPGLK